MASLVTTYQLIADILSFESSTEALSQKLQDQTIDWDAMVKEGSRQLVLPALYCRLQSKSLLHLLPAELSEYLESLAAINRNRNTAIIKQAGEISELLKSHNISAVFLKGTALLASNFYEDLAERMVGDIDILVDRSQIDDAFALIQANGYKAMTTTLGYDFFEHRHLRRLIQPKAMCAIELHTKLFHPYTFSELLPANILAHTQTAGLITIPSNAHVLYHTILNIEINDKTRYYKTIHFRSAYDTLVLLNTINFQEVISTLAQQPFKNYLKRLSAYFKLKGLPKGFSATYPSWYLVKHPVVHRLYYKTVHWWLKVSVSSNKLRVFICNSAYRKAIFNDKERIIRELKALTRLKK